MTHVVTSACVGHKYQDCVAVCPVEAFKEADTYLVIDPDECIDCAACVAECPVEAIFADTDVPDEEMEWIERNETESLELEIATGDSPVLLTEVSRSRELKHRLMKRSRQASL